MKYKAVLFTLAILAGSAGYSIAADISTHTFTNCNLPDTRMTASNTATFGEDHDYQPSGSQPGYTVYNPVGASSVTVDNRTGLMWVTNPNDAGIGGTYNWENALTGCETMSYATYADWRLPNVRELTSIESYTGGNPDIHTAYFLNTQSQNYWSSTTLVSNPAYAWLVSFNSAGGAGYILKTTALYLRCVRGGP